MRNIFLIILFSLSTLLYAEIPVTGLVTDAGTGKPVPAARISVINKNKSVTTDDSGRFKLEKVDENDVLKIEAYDYNIREFAVKGIGNINVKLFSDFFSRGADKKSDQIVSANTTLIENKSMAISADELLYSGLGGDIRTITKSGVSGIGNTMFIRGINSLNLNAQPLVIIDGVILNSLYDAVSIHDGFNSNILNNIDVNDIESISVVKDGSGIYGSKASNGIIFIKTRRAVSAVTKIRLNVVNSFTGTPSNYPLMNGEQYRIFANDMFGSKGIPATELEKMGFMQTSKQNPLYNKYHNNTDWNSEVYQTGKTSMYNIDVTGGDDKALYYFSIGYTMNDGLIKLTDFSRMNSRFNADLKLTSHLDMALNIAFTRNERTLQDDGANFYSSPVWLSKIKSPFMSPYTFTSSGGMTSDYDDEDEFGIGNPSAVIVNSLNGMKNYNFDISLKPEYRINKNFSVNTLFNYGLYKTIERRFVPLTGTTPRLIEGKGYSENEINSQVMRKSTLFDETSLRFGKKIGLLHDIKALAGFRFIQENYESDYAEEHNTGSDNNTTITGDYDFLYVDGINNQTKSLSYFLSGDYNYDRRYYINAAVSVDGSSRFGKNTDEGLQMFGNSWAVLPSLNAAWTISSEEFFNKALFINHLKLRAGLSITGNDGLPDYESLSYFSYVKLMDRANGMIISNLANEKLQWETANKANIGLDMSLLEDRITLGFDLYSSLTNNMIVFKEAPIISAQKVYLDNDGSMRNKGFELTASLRAISYKKFNWELGINAGHYKNKIVKLDGGEFINKAFEGEIISRVGEAAGSFYGYKFLGVYKDINTASTYFTNPESGVKSAMKIRNEDGTYTSFSAGDAIFEDVDKNGVIDEDDKQIIGNPNPDYFGTFYSNMQFDRFKLNAVFSFSSGNDVYNYSRRLLESGKDFSNQTLAILNRWTANGQVTDMPKAVWGDPMGNSGFSDRWIEDGSFIRLKNVTLSYDLPLKSTYLQGLGFWISANNVLIVDKYLGLDPEVSSGNNVFSQGIDSGLTPSTRSFIFGLRINL